MIPAVVAKAGELGTGAVLLLLPSSITVSYRLIKPSYRQLGTVTDHLPDNVSEQDLIGADA